jgi:DNA (cytosine-5)-methyltransferase 1
MKTLDLFCGAGGFSAGMEIAGFEIIGGIDVWKPAISTFAANHRGAAALQHDIASLKNSELKSFSNIECIIGGPPCQPFSTSGKRAIDDDRATLVREFARIVRLVKPDVFVFENVRGFASFAKGSLLKEILDIFADIGYSIAHGVLNAADFGAPQNRERFFIIGSLGRTITLPQPVTGSKRTFHDATSDLPPLKAGQKATEYLTDPQNQLQQYYRRKNPKELTEHVAKNHSEKLIKMMEYIPPGLSAHEVDMPYALKPRSGYKNTYKRIRSDQPSPTITRNFCVPSSANCIHPTQHRALTLREAARLQTFADDFVFYGNDTQKRIQVGNAVPLFLAKAIGESIKQ